MSTITDYQREAGLKFANKLNKPTYLIKMHNPQSNVQAHPQVRDNAIREMYEHAVEFVHAFEYPHG